MLYTGKPESGHHLRVFCYMTETETTVLTWCHQKLTRKASLHLYTDAIVNQGCSCWGRWSLTPPAQSGWPSQIRSNLLGYTITTIVSMFPLTLCFCISKSMLLHPMVCSNKAQTWMDVRRLSYCALHTVQIMNPRLLKFDKYIPAVNSL